MIAALHVLPTVLCAVAYVMGAVMCLLLILGFWRGLGLRAHGEGHRAPPLSRYFWWAND